MTATRKAVLSPETRAILAHLRNTGARTFAQLHSELAHRYQPSQLRTRLRVLVDGQWLVRDYTHAGADADLCWAIHPLARGAVALVLGLVPDKTALVPPRTNNVMAGLYIHQPMRAVRPGALDYAAVASRGQHC